MFPEPEYAENVIAGVIFRNTFAWYVTDYGYWYLDYTKYDRALLASGYTKPIGDHSFRFNIAVLNEETAEEFLNAIADKRVSATTLSQMMKQRKMTDTLDDLLAYAPCFLVNFDQRSFASLYPEMIRFDRYVPDGWVGTNEDFRAEVPQAERYWMDNGHDMFQH